MPDNGNRSQRSLRYWNKHAASYDKQMAFFERVLFRDTRSWICQRARGDVLDIAVGTGLNLGLYPHDIQLTGIEHSPAMLDIARQRATDYRLAVTLREGDAHHLDFPDHSYDTVVCTFSLCEIADEKQAISEMHRVLRPGGRLLLADHVASTAWPIRAIQRTLELITVPLGGEHFLRRPSQHLEPMGFEIEERQRFRYGIVERLAARKPS